MSSNGVRVGWVVLVGVLGTGAPGWGQNYATESDISLGTPSPHLDEDSPRLAVSDEKVMAVWTSGGGARRASWRYSTSRGRSWSGGGRFEVEDPARDGVFGLPSVCADDSGTFHVAALYDRSATVGGGCNVGLYHASPEADSVSWTGPTFPMPFMRQANPSSSLSLDLPALACSQDGRHLYLAFTRRESSPTTGRSAEICLLHGEDGVWSTPRVISGSAAEGAALLVDLDGSPIVFWYDMAADQIVGCRSEDHGDTFETFVVSTINANLSYPPGYDRNTGRANGVYCQADWAPVFPTVAIDRSQGPRRGTLYAVWPERVSGSADPVSESVQEQEPNEDFERATRIEYGQDFVGTSISSDAGNGFDIDTFYFEGRAGDTVQLSGSITRVIPGTPGSYCGTGYRLRSPGLPWGTGCLSQAFGSEIGTCSPMVFTLPVDGRYYASAAAGGMESISYRFRLQRLVPMLGSEARDHRDIVMVASADGGRTWSPKRLVNDDPPRFDNFLPEVAVDGLGQLHVTWYDRRDDPDRGMDYHVYWTSSEDGGEHFGSSIRLSELQSALQPGDRARLGDHMGLCGTSTGIVAAWTYATADFPVGRNEHNIRARSADLPSSAAVTNLRVYSDLGRAQLSWDVADPHVLSHMDIHRRGAGFNEEFTLVAQLARSDDPRTEHYSFTDTTVVAAGEYSYELELILANGESRRSEAVTTLIPPLPSELSLRLVAFGPGTESGQARIELLSPIAGAVELVVYDVLGSPVRVFGATIGIGKTLLMWDLNNGSGHRVPAGVYLLEARIAGYRDVLKIAYAG